MLYYSGAYIKQHDYLIKLYSETADKKYEEKIKALEDYYYENYNNLNKRAKYMNNQLQENYDDIRNKNLDYNILLEGKYEKEVVYYKEEDIKDNEIDKIDSGVASMAIILSSMKEENISPIELADYYDSSVEFFQNIVKQDKYKLQVEKLEANEITKVKRLLSDGKHMAVVLIKSGELASEDNYIVLYGIETKNGVNYFLALDPNKDNIIKVKASLFLEQALGYWVYSEE